MLIRIIRKDTERSFDDCQANILRSCYRETEIGLAGNLSDSFAAAVINSDNTISAILLDSKKGSEQSGVVSIWSRHRLQVFALVASSSIELERILVDLKSSRWWNHMAQFYVFGMDEKDAPCSDAFKFLWTAWTMDILGAKFVCNDGNDEPMIYTFNPYTQNAPPPWTLERTYQGVNNHPWALFVRKYQEKLKICENIDFEPTNELGQYEVRLTMTQEEVFLNSSETDQIARNHFSNTILLRISRHMNITYKMVLCENKEPLGSVSEDGRGQGRVKLLADGRSDFMFLPVPLTNVPELPKMYPSIYQKIFSVTQYTAYLSQWQKILSAIDHSSRIFVCIVMVMNVIFLKYALRQSFMIAFLDTIRMICNSCFTKLPNNLGPRIYLVGLFCFLIVIQALFQGQLSALLAKQIRRSNINNQQDLLDSDYFIYGWYDHQVFFSNPAYEGRFVGIDIFKKKCTDYVLLNYTVACVGPRRLLTNDAVKLKLHMSNNPVLETPITLLLRKNWPLEMRLNRHQTYYFESGLLDHEYESSYAADCRILAFNENAGNDKNFKILTTSDLNFAFVILAGGLTCATLSFLVECYFGRKRSITVKSSSRCRH